MSKPVPPELTLLVFKNNDTSRTFRVPLGWISRFGWAIVTLVAIALFSSFFAVKFYRVARRADPARLIELEQALGELKTSNRSLEAKVRALPIPVPVPTVTVTALPIAKASVQPVPLPSPPPLPAAVVVAPPVTASDGALTLFSAFPTGTLDLSSKAASLPITISPAKTLWSGKTLKIDFNIHYTGSDKQQGRIILLARGANALLAYPDGILNRAGSEALISPQQGEYFSVSRFREVNAEFGPVKTKSDIKDVEIMILSLDGKLLFYQKIALEPSSTRIEKASAPVPTPTLTPAPTATVAPVIPAPTAVPKSEFIQPGVDQ